MNTKCLIRKIIYVCCITLSFLFFAQTEIIATGFTNASMRHSRTVVSQAVGSSDPILVIVKVASTAVEASLGIAFNADYTVNGTASNITVSTSNLPSSYHGLSSITTMPGIGASASAVSGNNVTFTVSNLSAGTTYGFYITGGITNPASTGEKTNKISTHTSNSPDFNNYSDAIDSSRVGVYFVSANGASTDSDQIVLTVRVAPAYSLALSGQSISLDTSLSSVEYPGGTANALVNGITATATTNAPNGHIIWMKANSSAGLTSSVAGSSIAFAGTPADGAVTALSAGTEGVVVDVDLSTNGSNSLAIASEFDSGTLSSGGTPSTSFQQIASATGPVGGTGDVVTIMPRVAISASTKAADDYTNTFTIVGAGNF